MDYYKKASFIKSVVDVDEAPLPRLKEVLFVGKSNVGKSSIINALTNNTKLAYTSSKPGHTRLLNYYLIDDKEYFVDCPGYGYSQKKDVDYKFYGDMVEKYFTDNKYLKLIVFLLDSRHLPSEDDYDFYKFLLSFKYPFIIAMSKCDKLNQSERFKIYKNIKDRFGEIDDKNLILLVSTKDYNSLKILRTSIDFYLGK